MTNRTDADRRALAEAVRDIAIHAGKPILEIYETDFEVREKDDDSPVTAADEAAERVILAELRRLAPDIPAVAEEQAAAGEIPEVSGRPFWLVDPLDGTREFISRNGEFTVNIALIEDGEPVLGAVHVPARGVTYWSDGEAAWRSEGGPPVRVSCRAPSKDGLVVVASRSHRDEQTDKYMEPLPVKELVSAGSSLKLCLVADGSADLYPRLGRTMEWDIAAGHAVLRAAGGTVKALDGTPLQYGKRGFVNPHFVAEGLRP